MKTGLFIPCYVKALYPEVGEASLKLLKYYGLDVYCPKEATCCGQPMANGGFENMGTALADRMEELFGDCDYVVSPSVSCTSFVRVNYPRIMDHECRIASRAMDIVEFLHDVLQVKEVPGVFPHTVSIHNSCHGVRELGLSSPSERMEPRFNKIADLLGMVGGITVREPERCDECCGFGGLFMVEEPAVSKRMAEDKVSRHLATGADCIVGPDCSCLMNMERAAHRKHLNVKFLHVVQVLAYGL